jgi:hypothetical protein
MNSCFVSTSFTFLCYKSDLSVRLSCIFFVLICCLKIAGVLRFTFYVLRFTFVRFVSRTFSVVNGSFPMVWILPWKNAAGPAWRKWRNGPLREGRWDAATVAPSSFLIRCFWELTHVVLKINFLLSSVLFRSTSFVFRFSSTSTSLKH